MTSLTNFGSPSSILKVLSFVLGSALLTVVANGQVQPTKSGKLAYAADPANLPDAIAKLNSGDFALVHVEMIAEAHAVQEIPALEKQFLLSSDPVTKGKIAGALVRLGDKDDTYWNFLAKQATLVAEAPSPWPVDSQGKLVPGQPTPEFVAWASAHGLLPDPVYQLPGRILLLGETGDPRGIPILRKALLSPDYFIQAMAAKGLAQAQDKNSIPLIIEACQKAPDGAASGIAAALVYFDDPRAQSAFDKYVPNDMAKMYRDAKASGATPFH